MKERLQRHPLEEFAKTIHQVPSQTEELAWAHRVIELYVSPDSNKTVYELGQMMFDAIIKRRATIERADDQIQVYIDRNASRLVKEDEKRFGFLSAIIKRFW